VWVLAAPYTAKGWVWESTPPAMGSEKFGKCMFKIVRFRAKYCYILPIKEASDFCPELKAINFIVKIFEYLGLQNCVDSHWWS